MQSSGLILSAGDSPVNQSVAPENAEGKMMSDGCGPSSLESFAQYDRASSSWKTSQACLVGGLETYSATWPPAGMMRNGRVYRRQRLVHRISVLGSTLWPTPNSSDGQRLRLSSVHIGNAIASHKRRGKKLGAYLAIKTHEYGASPTPELAESLMGFPIGWTELEP
jgi:hypothetical protein